MKLFILGLSLLLSSVAFGKSCEEPVLKDYINALEANDYHHLTGQVFNFQKLEKSFTYYGKQVELGYDFDVTVFIAASEFMSGYGLEAVVVDPATCKTLKMVNVYTE
jgi:hypothetical protein